MNARDSDSATDDIDATPTIVLGLGDKGIEDAKAVQELAEREGVSDKLLEIWINSRSVFPDHDDPGIKTFHLEKPDKQHIPKDQASRPYVSNERDIEDAMGAKRWREIAKYLVDTPENIGRLEDFIRTRITRFLEEFLTDPDIDGPDGANVVLIAGGGGGTGSGCLPLISAMVNTITNEMSAEGPLSSITFQQWGIVSVSTVENTQANGVLPDVKPRFLSNTAMLLSELRAVAGEGEPSLPLEIPIIATEEGANLRRERYRITENPFTAIYLMRFAENGTHDIDGSSETLQRTAASIVFRWMRQDKEGQAAENAADDLAHTFYEVRGITFEAPTGVISGLFEARQERDALEGAIDQLESDRRELEIAAAQVRAVRDSDSGSMLSFDQETLATGIEPTAVQADGGIDQPARRVRDLSLKTANTLTVGEVSEELIEDRIETLQLSLNDEFHDAVPADELIGVVTIKAIVDQLAATRDSHSFPEQVRSFVDKNVDALESFNGAFDESAPPAVQYSEIVRPFIKHRIDSLRDDLADTTPVVDYSTRSSLKSQISRIESELERLDRLSSEHSRLVETVETAQEMLERELTALQDELDELAERHERVLERIDAKRTRHETATSRIDSLRNRLVSPEMGRTATLPVRDPDRIDPEIVSDHSGISTLISEGIVDQHAAANHVINALETGGGSTPLDDRLMTESGTRSPAEGRPIVMCHPETLPKLWTTSAGDDSITDTVSSEFAFDHKRITQRSDSDLTILVEYGNIHFENFLHPIGVDALGDKKTEIVGLDVDLTDSLAYPELLGLDPQEEDGPETE